MRATNAAKLAADSAPSVTAAPAASSPSVHIAPRWVLTPPVTSQHAAFACPADLAELGAQVASER